MMRIQFRIKPLYSLLDIDIPKIKKRLSNLGGISRVEIFDERASDAAFITIIVTLSDSNRPLLEQLKRTLLGLSDVTPFIVNEHGEEISIRSIHANEFNKYAKKSVEES